MNNHDTKQIKISNSFGAMSLTPITDFVPINNISINSYPQTNEHLLPIEDAAKVALISDNKKVQICFPSTHRFHDSVYVVYHQTPRTAAICSVVIDRFNTGDKSSPIEKINQSFTPVMSC